MIQDTRVHPAPSVSRGSQAALAYVGLVVAAGIGIGRGRFSPWAQRVGVAVCIPATLIVVWRASRSGEAWIVRIHDRMNVLLTLGGVLMAVSVALSVYRWSSLLGLLEGIGLIGLFSFSRDFVSSGWSRRHMVELLFWIGAGVSTVGLVLFSVRGTSVGVVKRLVDALLVADITDSTRLAIGFGYANSFAAFLLVPLAAGLGLALGSASIRDRAVFALGSLIMLVAMLESGSRGGLLVLALMAVVGSLLLVRVSGGSKRAWKRVGLLYGAFGAVMAVLVIVPPLRQAVVEPIVRRLLSIGSELQTGTALTSGLRGRLTMMSDALRYARAYPVLGSGVGTYASTYMQFRTTMFFSSDPHSLPLKVLTETGIVGLAMSAAIVIAVFRRFWRSVRDVTHEGYVGVALFTGCAALLLHACIDWDFVFLAFPIMLAVICGMYVEAVSVHQGAPAKAVSVGMSGRHREGSTTERSHTRSGSLVSLLRRLARPVVVCWAVACIIMLTGAVLASAAVRVSSVMPDRALSLLHTASSIDSLNAEYPYQRAGINVVLDAQSPGDYDRVLAVRSDFDRAIALNPRFPLYGIDYARFLLKYGLSDAVQVYEDLVKIDPVDPGTYAGLAVSYLKIYENVDKAGYWADKAISVDATYAEGHLVKGMVLEQRGDVVAAAAEYQKASELDATSSDALVMLGTMEKKQGNLRAAARALCEASTRTPRDASIRSALAAIAPVIDVSVPQEGDKAGPGQELVLQWDVSGKVAGVEMWDVYLIPATGVMVPVATDLNKTNRSWTWTIPVTQTPGEYRLIVYARTPSQGADAGGDWLSFGRSGTFSVQSAGGH